jgi:hypothetical protein
VLRHHCSKAGRAGWTGWKVITYEHATAAATLTELPEDPLDCEAQADAVSEQAARMTVGDSGVKARYKKLCEEAARIEKVSDKNKADVLALQV